MISMSKSVKKLNYVRKQQKGLPKKNYPKVRN